MHVKIELIKAGSVCRAAARRAERRRMELQRAAGKVVVDVVPSYVNMVGIRAEVNCVIKL